MRIKTLSLALTALLFGGCDIQDSVKEAYDDLKNRYEAYVDAGEERGERPFEVIFQQDESHQTVVSSRCDFNAKPSFVYFMTQQAASSGYFDATASLYSYPNRGILKPFWDVRYTNPVARYIDGTVATDYPNHSLLTGLDGRLPPQNQTIGTDFSKIDPSGSVVQTRCTDGILAGGTTLNLYDAPEQILVYAGIASTYVYQIHDNANVYPWRADGTGNLVLQASFDRPIYRNFETNVGGSVAFNVMLYNKKINQHINYVIAVYAAGSAWVEENSGMKFDPTTHIVHVGSVVSDNSWWTTKSPKSLSIVEIFNTNANLGDDGRWPDFFRVNISYNNLLAVLQELKQNPPPNVAGVDFGLSPQDWEVLLAGIQYELAEEGGKALLSGSFRGFEVYTSTYPF